MDTDPVNHPQHYTTHPSGVECIEVTEHFNFNVGNAIKYLWRAGSKPGSSAKQDLQKAAWYVNREIDRRKSTMSALRQTNPHNIASETTLGG